MQLLANCRTLNVKAECCGKILGTFKTQFQWGGEGVSLKDNFKKIYKIFKSLNNAICIVSLNYFGKFIVYSVLREKQIRLSTLVFFKTAQVGGEEIS